MTSFAAAVETIKGDVSRAVPADLVNRATNALGILGRNRVLTPAVTTHLALHRALNGGTAITHLRHLAEVSFTPSAYCQAIARLPETFFRLLQILVTDRMRDDRPQDRWNGHRLFLIDGTGVSMPDTPDLQAAFGQPGGQKFGCGFPVAHILALFEARSGYLLKTIIAPLRTHDLTHAAAMHPEMQAGDVLVGDRAFGSFAHLALCRRRELHAVFRAHQRRRHTTAPDRLVRYTKPSRRPAWMTVEEYEALPGEIEVREIRVRVRTPGRRLRTLVLVTTLLDRRRYPARTIAPIYEQKVARRDQFSSPEDDDGNGRPQEPDGGGSAEGDSGVRPGLQPGTAGDAGGGRPPRRGGGPRKLRRCLALAATGEGRGGVTSVGSSSEPSREV